MRHDWRCLALGALLAAAPAWGQTVEYVLVDSGRLDHAELGRGVEMRIQPEPMPEGGLRGGAVEAMIPAICRHYAPSVIPFVMERMDVDAPAFVAVRVVSGDAAFGTYILQVYEIEDGTCGDAL